MRRTLLGLAVGGALAVLFFGYEWASAPRSFEDAGYVLSDGGQWLGRYWEGRLVAFFAVVNWFRLGSGRRDRRGRNGQSPLRGGIFYEVAFLYGGGLALGVGAVVAFLIASSVRRGWLVVGIGGALALAFFVYEWSQASNGRDGRGCHDCEMFLGRYWQWYLVVFFAALNWFAWSLGVALGGGARAAIAARRELREQRGAA